MGNIIIHPPVKLIIGLISGKETLFLNVGDILKKRFDDIDFKSQILPFTHTNYYENEFGQDLKRVFFSFNKLIPPQDSYKIKIYTNRIEKKISSGHNRQINIDPGYLDASKLVLLSTKNYNHRIYIRSGIYAEVTLCFQDKTFKPWPWTYPDYKTDAYIGIFNSIRQIYLKQLRGLK